MAMPERPLLILPNPGEPLPRRKRGGGGGAPHVPSRERQAERLAPKFDALRRAMEARRVRLQAESHDLVPEEVVVLETVGGVENFVRAVEKVAGMEWLAEIDATDIPPDEDFFETTTRGERRPDKALRGRLFMVFTNQDALREILSLWKVWQEDGRPPYGFGLWKTVFAQLHDVRVWGVRDRLYETGVLDDWRERVTRGEEIVPCEIELWRRGTPEQRRYVRDRVVGLVVAQGDRLLPKRRFKRSRTTRFWLGCRRRPSVLCSQGMTATWSWSSANRFSSSAPAGRWRRRCPTTGRKKTVRRFRTSPRSARR